MKILQLITGLGQGGAEQIVVDLATRLDPRRYQVSVCSILDIAGGQGVHAARLERAGIRVLSLGLTGKVQLRRALALRSVLETLRPDVLHCHMFHANLLGRWAGRRAHVPNIIATVHIAERRWRPWRFWLERKTDRLGTLTVCVSESVLGFHSRKTGVPRGRFIVIPNGIDTARFARPTRPPEETRAALGIPSGAPLIGSVGRLDPQKGYAHLLHAFATIGDDAQLVIAGDGPERGLLESLAAHLGCAGRVHLIGRRPDVPDLLHAFDLFVLPSIYEGLPLALIEAMAAGRPIVASAVDSIPEVLGAREPGGSGGTVVPPADPAALAAAIRGSLGARPVEQAARAQDRARRLFDVNVMVRRYAELYDSLARQTVDSQPPSA